MWNNKSLIYFWACHPALFYGIAFLLGICSYLNDYYFLLIPCVCLWLPFLFLIIQEPRNLLKPLFLNVCTFLFAWGYIAAYSPLPLLPDSGIQGIGRIKIKSLKIQQTFFGEQWLYRCELQQFFPEQALIPLLSSLPCLITLRAEQGPDSPRPLANQDYWIFSRLKQTEQGTYFLKVNSKTPWIAIENSWSWAEIRYQWKRKVSKWIERHLSHSLSASFLAGLATGEFDDTWMRQQFARFGLQHLLAISGFHFALIASFLSLLLRFILPSRIGTYALLVCLGLYAFFLGPQASILRAWMMCSLTLAGKLINKQTTALNSLGVALLGILVYDPFLSQEIGFQLSFATTAAILLFYSPAQRGINQLLPQRRLSDVLEMNVWNQHGYCLLAFLRQGFALTLAVNAVVLPLTLYYFHQFPLMSVLYNLFYPLLASLSLCLLLIAGLLSFIPFLAENIHNLNRLYTDFLLHLTYDIPSTLDGYVVIDFISPHWIIGYLCLLSLGGILWKEKLSRDKTEKFQT